MWGLVARCSNVNKQRYFYTLMSFWPGWNLEKATGITFSFKERQQTFAVALLDGGLAGGSSRSCPFPDPHGCESSLDFWRFCRQRFLRPSSGSIVHALIRKLQPLLQQFYIVHFMYYYESGRIQANYKVDAPLLRKFIFTEADLIQLKIKSPCKPTFKAPLLTPISQLFSHQES